jgi:uncharacterized membrane protein (DUF2068 family)
VAIFELTKGLLVLLVGLGAAAALRRSIRHWLRTLVDHIFPVQQLMTWLGITRGNLGWVALVALIYAGVRIAEAWGLWRGRTWAEWLALIGAALYVPFELYELIANRTMTPFVLLVLNLALVAFMAVKLREKRKLRAELLLMRIAG